MSETNEMSIEELFKNEYENWDVVEKVGFCNEANIVAVFPKDEEWFGGINIGNYTETPTVTQGIIWDLNSNSLVDPVYQLEQKGYKTYISKSITDRLLDSLNCTLSDLTVSDKRSDWPVIVETGTDKSMYGIIAPRLQGNKTKFLESCITK